MTCVSVASLCAVLPGLAAAQSVDTGASGQALTTGTITSSTGAITDDGANNSVFVLGPSTAVTVDSATINSTAANSTGLNISSSGGTGSGVSAVFTGANNITGVATAVMVSGVNENASLDTTAGGGTYGGGLNANSQSGSATLLNGSNLITGSTTQVGLTATVASTGAATVNSTGGSISSGYGISASSQGGDVTVGQGAGVTTAINLTSSTGMGIAATTSGAGNITVQTGTGGTIDGGAYGIFANNGGGSGTTNVTVGDAIGATTAPSADGVDVISGSGSVTINATGAIAAGGNGVYSYINSGAGNLTVTTAGVTSSGVSPGEAGVNLSVFGSSSTGALSYTLTGANAVSGGVGVYAVNWGAGAVSVQAADAGSSISGSTGAGVQVTALGAGTVTVDVAGSVSGATNGVYSQAGSGATSITVGGPVSATTGAAIVASANNGSISINTGSTVTSTGGDGIDAFASTGATSITANGAINAAGAGIYATSTSGAISVNAASTVTGATGDGIYVYSAGQSGTTGGGAVSVGASNQPIAGAVQGGGDYGIYASGAGDVSVYAGAVTGGTHGVSVTSQSNGASDGAVIIDLTGQVTSGAGYGVRGINTGVLSGDTLTISTAGVTATGGDGIKAETSGGDITINAGGPIVANAGGNVTYDGIYADGAGDSLVTVNASGAVTGSDNGIEVYSAGATARSGVNITTGGSVTAGAGQSAIMATVAGLGDLTIATAAGTTLSAAGGTGILANVASSGANNIAINNAAAIGGAGAAQVANGIVAQIAAGDAGNITVNSIGDIDATTVGISASNSGSGTVNIGGANGVGGVITTAGTGIAASTTTGALTITTAAGGSIAPGASVGIQATSVSGPITIVQNGDIGAAGANGTVGMGISAQIQSGSSDINITSNGGIYVAAGSGLQSAGIYAVNGGTGAINVTSNGVIDPGAYGIVLQGAGAVSVTTNGSVTGAAAGLNLSSGAAGLSLNINGNVTATGGPAIVATSAGAATINIASGSVVTGLVTAAGQAVIELSTASGQSSTINVASGAVVAAAQGSVSDVAIRATGGSVVVNNNGDIEGTVDFSALTGANTGTLKNAPGTSFVTSGTSNFGAGNANFANSGTLQTQGALTTFQFGGANNVFNNAGTVVVGSAPVTTDAAVRAPGGAASSVATTASFVLTNLTTFANSGTLNMINGVVGDSIVAAGSNYVGSGKATLAVDTVIGGPGSASDVLVVGTSAGHTSVQIQDAAPTSFGAYNPTGTVIVQGITHPGDFTLDPASSWYNPTLFGGALDKPGFFFSQLGVDPATKNTVLISAPKLQAYQFATLPTQAQTIWYDTTPQPERQGELRDQLAGAGQVETGPGLWVKVEGSTAQRDVAQSWSGAGNSYSYDASYTQDVTSEMAGFDDLRRTADGWGLAYGTSAGYVDLLTRFGQMQTSTQAEGFTLNGYATVMRKDVFAAFTVGGDELQDKLSSPQLTGYAPQTIDVGSLGATFEAGVRKPFLFGSTLEPSFGVAYVYSDVSDLATAGARFHFDTPESLRLSLGARLTGAVGGLGTGQWRTRYEVSLRAVDDVDAANAVGLASAGPTLPLTDNFQKQFGEARIGLITEIQGGWSGSADVRERFSGGSTDTGLSIALRYQF